MKTRTQGSGTSRAICAPLAGTRPKTRRKAERTASGWVPNTELTGYFWHPRFAYLSTGKKVFVYGDMVNGGLFVAIEN